MPILAAVAIGLGENPLLLLILAAITLSCAFSIPVATAPNAIVFGSGHNNPADDKTWTGAEFFSYYSHYYSGLVSGYSDI